MHLAKVGIALVAFVVGCGAGGFASQLVIPTARAGTNPGRWEYLIVNGDQGVDGFNRAGVQGWELVAASNAAWVFKRPLP